MYTRKLAVVGTISILLAGCGIQKHANLKSRCPTQAKSSFEVALNEPSPATEAADKPIVYELDGTRTLRNLRGQFSLYDGERCVRRDINDYIADVMGDSDSLAVRINGTNKRYVLLEQQDGCGSGTALYKVFAVAPGFPKYAEFRASSEYSLVVNDDGIARFRSFSGKMLNISRFKPSHKHHI